MIVQLQSESCDYFAYLWPQEDPKDLRQYFLVLRIQLLSQRSLTNNLKTNLSVSMKIFAKVVQAHVGQPHGLGKQMFFKKLNPKHSLKYL